ncbi:hypothetical protein N9954_06835 [Maribacter sp.]|nr:hypothetical protein [Maribacter sp.]
MNASYTSSDISTMDIQAGFVCPEFRNYVKNGILPGKRLDFEGHCRIARMSSIDDFLTTSLDPSDRSKDIYAICVGYDGYGNFCRNKKYVGSEFAKRIKPEILVQDAVSLTENEELIFFFKNPCFLFAHNEEIVKPGAPTEYKKIHNPEIDAHVITANINSGEVVLNNQIPQKNRVHHGTGVFSWSIPEKAFDITFPSSDRKLILRFEIPKLTENARHIDLILGSFSYVHESGRIVWGTVLLKKEEKETLDPFCFEFKNPERQNLPEPIQQYFFDRYKNWHKLPDTSIFDLDSLKVWLSKKHEQDYTRRKVTEIDYVIMYPMTSFEDKKEAEMESMIKNQLDLILKDFKKNNAPLKNHYNLIDEPGTTPEQRIIKIHDDLTRKYEKERIVLFPVQKVDFRSEGLEKLNKDLLDYINRSISVVFIIPGFDANNKKLKYTSISSIYTIIGYCVALKKKTFVFYQNEKHLPFILKRSVKNMELYVWKYQDLGEIPFHFYHSYHKEKMMKPIV